MLDEKKLIDYFNDIIDENQKYIDDDMDGDNECLHEIQTLEFVITTLENKRFHK